jgi:uncharacterized phage-like protein YoqJ
MIIAATGHRPDKLGGYDAITRRRLKGMAVDYLRQEQPARVISGMAQGWDQAVAAAAIELGIPFVAAVPFRGQEDRWPAQAQQRYNWLLGHASGDVLVFDGYPVGWEVNKALQDRNVWMVDYVESRGGKMAALWDGTSGGTCNCIRYAEKKGVPFDNLWGRWTMPDDIRALLGDLV